MVDNEKQASDQTLERPCNSYIYFIMSMRKIKIIIHAYYVCVCPWLHAYFNCWPVCLLLIDLFAFNGNLQVVKCFVSNCSFTFCWLTVTLSGGWSCAHMHDRDTTTACSAFPLCLSQTRYRLVHTRDLSSFVEFYIYPHTCTATCLTHLHMCSHTHTNRLLLSSFVKSYVCTHTPRHGDAYLFDTFAHVHTLTHTLLRRMSPKREAKEEVQQLAAFVSLPFPVLLMRFAAFCSSTCSHYYYCCCCLFLIMRFGFINSYKAAAAAYHAWWEQLYIVV